MFGNNFLNPSHLSPLVIYRESALAKSVILQHYLCVQDSLPNQDAACSAGALIPLLDIASAGPDQLAAKSAALAISALVCNHTANQDAVRYGSAQALGLKP